MRFTRNKLFDYHLINQLNGLKSRFYKWYSQCRWREKQLTLKKYFSALVHVRQVSRLNIELFSIHQSHQNHKTSRQCSLKCRENWKLQRHLTLFVTWIADQRQKSWAEWFLIAKYFFSWLAMSSAVASWGC